MYYLGISIIAAIILVAIVIRRLPYLRTPRLGLEIMSPKPYLPKTSLITSFTQRMQTFFNNLPFKRRSLTLASNVNSLMRTSYDPSPVSTLPEVSTMESEVIITQSSSVALPSGDFWQEETMQQTMGALELPSQGLITRRGESQKIAHELVSQADEAFRKKEFKKAERFYLQAATKDPENARIYNRLGVIYLQTKNYKDAVEAFRGALRFDDRVASRHYNISLAYMGKRDFRSAIKGLNEAIKLDPTNEKYRKTLDAIQKQPV
jgi:tetratricopeptide (TPR) repeat protein